MATSRQPERRPLKRLALLSKMAASSPIEVIVMFFIIVTFCYFQLLQAVKDSDFLNADVGPLPPPAAQPLFYRRIGSKWIGVGDGSAEDVDAIQVHLQPLIVSLDALPVKPSYHNDSINQPQVLKSIDVLDDTLRKNMSAFESGPLRFDPDLCFRDHRKRCFTASYKDGDAYFPTPRTTVLLYGFAQGTQDAQAEWLKQLPGAVSSIDAAHFNVIDAFPSSAPLAATDATINKSSNANRRLGISLPLSPRTAYAHEPSLRHMKNLSWVFYAFKAFVMRFWDLAKKADSADFCIMLCAYILMHATFVNLYINMRKLGSKFVLASSVLVSSVFGFIVTLFTAYLLNMTVNPVTLSEALPFMVVIIGFDKPFVLARAVFRHPAIDGPESSRPDYFNNYFTNPNVSFSSPDKRSRNSSNSSEDNARRDAKTAKDIVTSAVNRHGPTIVRDYLIEIAVLLVGAMSGVPGLKEFCQLGALILAFDGLFLFVFYVSVLTVMVEVHRIRRMRSLQRVDSTMDLAKFLDDGSNSPVDEEYSSLTFKQSITKLVTGRGPGENSLRTRAANLKLLLLAVFVGLHVLNLTTTLSTRTAAIFRHHSANPIAKVDSASAFLLASLDKLSSVLPSGANILVRVSPPALIHVFWPGLSSDAHSAQGPETYETVISAFDHFMTSWSTVVGDPVMSKWIVISLALSVALNGYLLKGISLGSTRAVAAESAARILLASTGQIEFEDEKPGKILRRHSASSEDLLALRTQRKLSMKPVDAPADESRNWASDSERSLPDSPIKMLSHPRPRRATNPKMLDQLEGKPPLAPVVTIGTPSVSDVSRSDLGTETPATTVEEEGPITPRQPRSLEQCVEVFAEGKGAMQLVDEEIILLVQKGKVAAYALEKLLKDHQRAVRIRRSLISRASTTKTLENSDLPFMHYDYSKVMGQCCENVIGYVPLPCGIAGPLRIDGVALPIPMATTEGALVASTSRGCKALNAGGGVTTVLKKDGMTRGPAVEFPNIKDCGRACSWVESEEGSNTLKAAFNTTSRFARLQSLTCGMAGRKLYIRFVTQTGDAMGMNMISKGTERALDTMMEHFPTMRILSLSGNYCTDKKPAAINWIQGRGKSVVAEAVISGAVVKSILKTNVADLVRLNIAKNYIGSAMAGSVGGNNAHAANMLTAIFLATGQDPAQNVESSNCLTEMEATNDGQDLLITCTMPCIEVGTIGGGTILGPQRAMLEMLGVAGPHPTNPGANAQRLARIICAAVMAGELSLMSAQAAGHLVQSHLALNRSASATPATLNTTHHTYLTPAPTRPSTPGISRSQSFLKAPGLTPLQVPSSAPDTPTTAYNG